MLQGKYIRKVIAATLLTVMLTNTIAPTISYALTSGPTQPEATSFEPIDTTDMVNPQTGDFTYNLPLIDVLGPEGGYPLSLSYHAGLQPNEDASWVGLGWTLNTGAINRTVNGYPDDCYAALNSSRVYWAGGTTTTYNPGVSVGIANTPISLNFGLSISQDTYRGFGLGGSVGVGAIEDGVEAGVGVGIAPYGQTYASAYLGIGYSDDGTSGSATINYNTETGMGYSADIAMGTMSERGVGLSMSSSQGGGVSVSEGGFTAPTTSNSKVGIVSTSTTSWSTGNIPVWAGLSISYGQSKTRYWTDQTTSTYVHGCMYPWDSEGEQETGYNTDDSYDTYELLEDPSYKNPIDYSDPTVVQGGSYPEVDDYSVMAQGLAGNMHPLLYGGNVLANNVPSDVTYVDAYNQGSFLSPAHFRFDNDFAGYYTQNYPAYDPSLDLTTANPPSAVTGSSITGSRSIVPYCRINPSSEPGYTPEYPTNSTLYQESLTGFSITNESGVTYNFGLPAYVGPATQYSELIGSKAAGDLTFNTNNTVQYAYTWYLTTITGPDYVDRNGNGIADAGDWGYWVNFEYGKCSNNGYVWRNPSEGFQKDPDANWQNVSLGSRDQYYLNAIRTRTNVALFEKSVRYDAKGESSSAGQRNNPSYGVFTDFVYPGGLFDNTSAQSFQLSHIYLLNAADGNFVTPSSGSLDPDLLDNTDVDAVGRAALEAKSIKIIDFNYDYSLCQNTSNSFDINNPSVKYGKLTLNSLNTRGLGGVNLLPPIQFQYDLGNNAVTETNVTINPVSNNPYGTIQFTTPDGQFQAGDMLNILGSSNTSTYLGVITNKTQLNSTIYQYTLANGNVVGTTTGTISTTKNPPYNKDAYDMWGMYKSDYNLTDINNNENLGRCTSPVSARSVDAWSLRSVTTQLGSQLQINYESDTYCQTVYNNAYSITMQNIVLQKDLKTIQFQIPTFYSSTNPSNIVYPGARINQVVLSGRYGPSVYNGTGQYVILQNTINAGPMTITSNNGLTGIFTAVLDNPISASPVSLPYRYGLSNTGPPNETQSSELYDLPTIISNLIQPTAIVNSTQSEYSNTIIAGNFTPSGDSYGGGIRVTSLAILNPTTNKLNKTSYQYNTPGTANSSGVTSYLPVTLDGYVATAVNNYPTLPPPVKQEGDIYISWSYPNQTEDGNSYKALIYSDAYRTMELARDLPPPGVIYQYVTVTNSVQNPDEGPSRTVPGSTTYQFEVFRQNMVGITDVSPRTGPVQNSYKNGPYFTRNMAIMKFNASLGNLISSTTYDNNGQMLTQTVNHYLEDGLQNLDFADFMSQYKARIAGYNYQGYIQTRDSEVKILTNQSNSANNGVDATLSAREEYPSIQTGQTTINYVTGIETSTQNLAFDINSGEVTKTLKSDSYGNNFLTQITPAYTIYPFMGPGIGSSTYDLNSGTYNLNMLTQVAETKTYTVDANNNNLGLVSANITTWSDQVPALGIDGTSYIQNNATNGDVWRPQSTYNWMANTQTSNGLTAIANFTDYNFNTPASSDPSWKKVSQATLYDVYSHELEQNDINNNYSAMHMDYGEQKVVLTGSPANYSEIAYSGAEDNKLNNTNDIQIGIGGQLISGIGHTGTHCSYAEEDGEAAFTYTVPTNNLVPGRDYEASVWVKPVDGSGDIGAATIFVTTDAPYIGPGAMSNFGDGTPGANGWKLLKVKIDHSMIIPGYTLNVSCINEGLKVYGIYFDDMRFQPLNAQTTAYVYDPFSGKLTYTLDNDNLYTRYEYDEAGRLVRTFKEKFWTGEFKTTEQQYHYPGTFYNDALTFTGAKNNCSVGTPASTVVNVPAGTIASRISVQDADIRANVYAQQYINQSSYCAPYLAPVIQSVAVNGYTLTVNWLPSVGWDGSDCGISCFDALTNVTTTAPGINFNIPPATTPLTITVPGPGNYSVTVNDYDYAASVNGTTITSAPYMVTVQ